MGLALRIGQSAYPLLAHRAAFLTWRIAEHALDAAPYATSSLLEAFFTSESLWMIDSQQRYEAARDRYLEGDDSAIVAAYAELAEGTLRRYASLVLALIRVAAGEAPQGPLLFARIGDVEKDLRRAREPEPLAALMLRFLERNLRNADAHSNVF